MWFTYNFIENFLVPVYNCGISKSTFIINLLLLQALSSYCNVVKGFDQDTVEKIAEENSASIDNIEPVTSQLINNAEVNVNMNFSAVSTHSAQHDK